MKARKYTLLLIVAVAATAAMATGCGGADSSAGAAPSAGVSSGTSSSSISISDFKFFPRSLRVPADTPIKVENQDAAAHTVTADDGHSFDSGTVDPGASATFQAPGRGTYAYHCTIHPFMEGTLTVR